MRELMNQGSFTLWATTTPAAITLPSHVSMLTGVTPEVHAILWNADLPLAQPIYPAVPTLFDLARRAGFTTALVAGKSKFNVFDRPATKDQPGSLTWKYISASAKTDDTDVAQHALTVLREHRPDVMFVHFPECDNIGHAVGWGTIEQLDAVARVDRYIGQLLDATKALNLTSSTLTIITTDHGGSGRTHGSDSVLSRTIPWIAFGPQVRKNYDLTRMGREHSITTYDTFATACYVLGISIDNAIEGKPVRAVFENQEMLISTFQPQMVPATMPVR